MKYAPMPVPTGKHPRTCAEYFSKHQCQMYAVNCFELTTGINLPLNVAVKTKLPCGVWAVDHVEYYSGDQMRGYALDMFIANYDFGLVRAKFAPQMVADERALLKEIFDLHNSDGGVAMGDVRQRFIETMDRVEIALAAAPVQAQEPFMYGIMGPDGKAHIDENCVAGEKDSSALHIEVNCLNDSPDAGYSIVPLFTAPVQPVAVPGILTDEKLVRAAYEIFGIVADDTEIMEFVKFVRAAAPAAQGDAKDAALLSQVAALANKWNADAIKDGFAGSDAAFELLEVLGWPDADIAAKAAS